MHRVQVRDESSSCDEQNSRWILPCLNKHITSHGLKLGLILPRSKVPESGEKNQITTCLILNAHPKVSVPLFFVATLTPTTVALHYHLCQES